MCLPSAGPAKRAARAAEIEEANRKRAIRTGNERVDQTFSQFDDNYYTGASDAYTKYYLPQLKRQFDEYARKGILSLADRGILSSSAGSRATVDMQDRYNKGVDQIRSGATDYTNNLRSNITGTKSDLKGLVASGVDPGSAASLAAERAALLSRAPEFSPLGDFFGQLAAQTMNRRTMQNEGYNVVTPKISFGGNTGRPVRTVN